MKTTNDKFPFDLPKYDIKKGDNILTNAGFVILDKDKVPLGYPNDTFQCELEELGEEDNDKYGLESIAIKKGIKFEYPILDVSEGQSYILTCDLKEPYRSDFIKSYKERNPYYFVKD